LQSRQSGSHNSFVKLKLLSKHITKIVMPKKWD